MKSFDIVIAGNGESALVCALSAKNSYTNKNLAIIKSDKNSSIIEKILSSLSEEFNSNLKIFYDEIINKSGNILNLVSGEKIKFEKLVIASGSKAIEPPIDGIGKKGVICSNNDPKCLKNIEQEALNADNIVIFGGGYVGVSIADDLLSLGKKITLIEKSKRLLPSAFDSEISVRAKEIIEERGGKVILDAKVKNIIGADSVSAVRLNNDEILDCDYLILCCGTRPNTELAERLGLIFDRDRGILVDEFFRTSDKDIFAFGECAAKFDFFTSDLTNVLLHKAKLEEAKLVGANLYSVIFNRGKIFDYLTSKKYLRDNIKTELKHLEVLNAPKDYIHLL